MRFANVDGRLAVVKPEGTLDIERASSGRFSADPQAAFERWDELRDWSAGTDGATAPLDEGRLGPPVPSPRQVLAIGLNYRGHAEEAGVAIPEAPSVFTKFPTSVGGPAQDVVLPTENVDWEVELVVAIGREARRVSAEEAWAHVAGVTVGQDLSERKIQNRPPAPQFSLGKSFPGFAPIGPFLVTPDELDEPDDLEISCALNGENVQRGRTADLVFSVPELISRLSAVLPLLPGDLIFTGTPAGVGLLREPPRFLRPGDELVSEIGGVGSLTTRLVGSNLESKTITG
jgi:2-keto-4-pentenoate hydratase/2-oxohepta-3-ene-1,7-dioic acid hydratase in catechol pathway